MLLIENFIHCGLITPPSPSSSQIHRTSLPTQRFTLFLTYQVQLVLPRYCSVKVQRGHTFTKNKPSFSQQLSVIDNPSARMGLHAHFPLHCWGFLWLEPLQDMHAITIATVPFIPIFDIGKLRLSDVPKVKHLLMRSTPIRVFYSLTSTLSPPSHHGFYFRVKAP